MHAFFLRSLGNPLVEEGRPVGLTVCCIGSPFLCRHCSKICKRLTLVFETLTSTRSVLTFNSDFMAPAGFLSGSGWRMAVADKLGCILSTHAAQREFSV